jgi:hypothetical protein
MRVESEALGRIGAAEGDAVGSTARLENGWQLAAERLGKQVLVLREQPAEARSPDPSIETTAREEARRLWARW